MIYVVQNIIFRIAIIATIAVTKNFACFKIAIIAAIATTSILFFPELP